MSQQSLFDTRREARAAIEPQTPTFRERVLAYIRGCGPHGATDQEFADGLEMLPDTVRARRCELAGLGLIRRSGTTRPSRHGGARPCAVWVVAGKSAPSVSRPSARHEAAIACAGCGFAKFIDTQIHNGKSVRRDCARCGRTLGFPVWSGRIVEGDGGR